MFQHSSLGKHALWSIGSVNAFKGVKYDLPTGVGFTLSEPWRKLFNSGFRRWICTSASPREPEVAKRRLHVVNVRRIVPYERGLDLLQKYKNEKLHALRSDMADSELPLDTLIFLEHAPVYTLGRNADVSHVLFDESDRNAPRIKKIDRGGEVTFHGPGQIVGYPVIDLRRHRKDLHWYMRQIEEVIVQFLARYSLIGERKDKYTGVWVGNQKVCAIGLNASKWITSHGFALNVTTDLAAFDKIIPCGISEEGLGVASLHSLLSEKERFNSNSDFTRDNVQQLIVKNFMEIFGYDHVIVSNIIE